MQVIDSKGRLVGKVKDIAFAVGKMGIALSVETEDGETKHISWEDVAAAADFILLKPTQSMSPLGEGEKTVDSINNQFKLKLRKHQQRRFAQHAVSLLHGFPNTKDGTATTTKNTFKKSTTLLFF